MGEKRLSLSSGCSRTRERELEGKREIEQNKEGRGREEAQKFPSFDVRGRIAQGHAGMNEEESEKRVKKERGRTKVCSSI